MEPWLIGLIVVLAVAALLYLTERPRNLTDCGNNLMLSGLLGALIGLLISLIRNP